VIFCPRMTRIQTNDDQLNSFAQIRVIRG